MFCPYCGKEMADNDAFCGFCGAKNETVKFNSTPKYKGTSSDSEDKSGAYNTQSVPPKNPTGAPSGGSAPTPSPKKKMSAGKIILTVFICCTVVVVLFFSLMFATFKVVVDSVPWDRIENYFEDFGDDFDDDFFKGYDEISGGDSYYKSFKDSGKFISGKTDAESNSYESEFGGLKFTLPTAYETFTQRDIAQLYEENKISAGEASNNLTVYDFYSVNKLTGTQLRIDYYNKDYYSDVYESYADYIDELKDEIEDYSDYTDGYVYFASDSTITLNGNVYTQIAAKITDGKKTYYEYDFVREVNGYYMKINVFTTDLSSVGELIDILNGESR